MFEVWQDWMVDWYDETGPSYRFALEIFVESVMAFLRVGQVVAFNPADGILVEIDVHRRHVRNAELGVDPACEISIPIDAVATDHVGGDAPCNFDASLCPAAQAKRREQSVMSCRKCQIVSEIMQNELGPANRVLDRGYVRLVGVDHEQVDFVE